MANDIQPNINGHQHSWADIRVNIMGRTLTGITGIDYDDEDDSEFYNGAGTHPVAFGTGNTKSTCKLKLYKYELDALQKAAKDKGIRIQEIPFFDIVVNYKETPDAEEVTDVIRNCKFKKSSKSAKQGDTKLETDIDIICSHIEWMQQ